MDEASFNVKRLQQNAVAMEAIAFAIACTMDSAQRLKLLKTLEILQLNVLVKVGEDEATDMRHFIQKLRAVTGSTESDPLQALAVETALYARDLGKKEALQSWLAIATPPEIGDEIREVLPPAPRRRAAGGKRGKGGAS